MNRKKRQKYAYSLTIALMFIAISGLITNARAQDWNRDRWEDRQRPGSPNGGYDNYGDGNNDRYGRDSKYYKEEEKGYRDGLRRGKEDGESNRIPDPNNSSHYRKGSDAYHAGFRRGYAVNYPQYAVHRRRW